MESLGHYTSLSHYLLLPWLAILLLSFQTMVQLKNKDATNQSIYWFFFAFSYDCDDHIDHIFM